MLIGITSGGMLYAQSVEATERAGRQELMSLAQICALQVDGEAHEKLQAVSQQNSPEYNGQLGRLADVLERTRNVRYIYTVRQVGNKHYFVLDPTPPGDADGDGVDDKSYLLDPMEDVAPAMIKCFETGIPSADAEPFADRWGTWLSAYAPIRDKTGRVVAVLGLDRDYRLIQRDLQDIREAFQSSLLLVGSVSLGVAWLFSGLFGQASNRRSRSRGYHLRRPTIELVLVFAVVALVIDGTIAGFRRTDLTFEQDQIMLNLARLANTDRELTLAGSVGSSRSQVAVQQDLAKSPTPWMSSLFKEELEAHKLGGDPTRETSMPLALATERQMQHVELAKVLEEARALDARLFRVLYVAAGLAVFAIVILRYASQQDQRMAEVESETSIATAQYQAVVENLPLGLFIVRDGDLSFANQEWERQADREDTETRLEALRRGLHPEDRDAVMAAILGADEQGTPFELTCRFVGRDGSISHIQCKGEPIFDRDGEYQHLLCFHADLTAIVEAKLAVQKAYGELESKNQLLSAALAELEENLESIVRSLVRAVEAKDPYTAGHSERVKQYSLWLGEELGLGPYEMRILELGSLVHDVGKIGIPDHILTKPADLTQAEYECVKQHPVFGVKIMEGVGVFDECLPIVRWHHERLDGTGYPDGLRGDEIPFLVRITAIADVFDAMVSTRAYRKGLEVDYVLDHLVESAQKGQVDETLARIFVDVIRRRGILDSGSEEQAA